MAAIVVMTVITPLKFGSLVGIPETTALFPADLFSWLIITWPVTMFPLFSGVVLMLALIGFRPRPEKQFKAFVAAGLWMLLGLVGYIGAINAGTKDFVLMQIPHGLGIGAYAASVYLMLSNRPAFRKKFLFIMLGTAALVALMGWEQRLVSFEETRRFMEQQEIDTGIAMSRDMKARVYDSRIYATLSSCNNLAGFLLMMLPVLFWLCWKLGERIEPKSGGRAVFLVLGILLMLIPFGMTQSRAAFACAMGAVILLVLISPVNWKIRLGIVAVMLLGLVGGGIFIWKMGRGFHSLSARLDYQIATLEIFAKNPLFGTGWGDFFHDYMIIKNYPSAEAPHDPHSMLAGYLGQCGIFGGLVCLATLLYPLWEGWRKVRRSTERFFSNIDSWVLLGIIGGTMHSQVDTNMQVPAVMCYLVGLHVILLTDDDDKERAAPKINRYVLQGIFMVVALWLALAGAVNSYQMVQGEKAFAELSELASPQGKKPGEFYRVTPDQVNVALDKVVKLRPYSPFPWQVAGDFMFGRGLYDAAERYYLKALELSPQRASINHRLHRVYRMTHREADAEKYLQRARELFPRNEDYQQPWSPK